MLIAPAHDRFVKHQSVVVLLYGAMKLRMCCAELRAIATASRERKQAKPRPHQQLTSIVRASIGTRVTAGPLAAQAAIAKRRTAFHRHSQDTLWLATRTAQRSKACAMSMQRMCAYNVERP